MTTKELMEYLSQYGEDEKISFIIVDANVRNFYPCTGYATIKDDGLGFPGIILEVGRPKSREEVEAEYGEEN